MSVYQFKARTITGKEISLEEYKGKVLVIVNTASKCGFTPQYEDLEKIYKNYKEKGVEILGFPSNQFAEQEPGNSNDIEQFCKLNYGVTFQLFEKTDVRGVAAHPLFNYLTVEKEFNGFDLNHPNGQVLNSCLKEKLRDFLLGNSIKWNFTKFLVDREGNVIQRFEPTSEPFDMIPAIEKLL
jgi:glutathione peroxidase